MYRAFSMIFFWSIFDGILMYVLPILISAHGFSKSEMGLIIGSSSLAGALFDVLASKYIKIPHYRNLYGSVFLLSASFIGILYFASTAWIFLLAMAMWGMYWDLFHFANFDLVSRIVPEKEHSSVFGIIGIFQSLGVLIAPVLAGLLIETTVGDKPFMVAAVMLLISFVVFITLCIQSLKKDELHVVSSSKHVNWFQEFRLWNIIGKQLAPVLILTFLIYIIDAFFWTIGPLIAESGEFGMFGGMLLVAYSFPALVIGWYVGKITTHFGKKKTALYSFFLGSIILSFVMFISQPSHMILLVLISSTCLGFALPALNGAYADYISETQQYEKEIQGIIDLFYNIGWMVGPICAGFLADAFGNAESISAVSLFCVGVSIILLFKMPKKIHIVVN